MMHPGLSQEQLEAAARRLVLARVYQAIYDAAWYTPQLLMDDYAEAEPAPVCSREEARVWLLTEGVADLCALGHEQAATWLAWWVLSGCSLDRGRRTVAMLGAVKRYVEVGL